LIWQLDEDFVVVLADLVTDQVWVCGVFALTGSHVETPGVVRTDHGAAFQVPCGERRMLVRAMIVEGKELIGRVWNASHADLKVTLATEGTERSDSRQLIRVTEFYDQASRLVLA
jgi:Na+-transporting NADH:ubiquinone oxidoreductase subunit NqrA